MSTAPNRSYLFAPGDHPRRSEKVLTIGADAAILDLEDAVANSAKVAARGAVAATLQRPRTCRAYVRVNAFDTPFCFGDIQAVVGPRLDGLLLPKLETPAQIIAVDWMVSAIERALDLPERGIDIIPIIETARGHDRLRDLMTAAAGLSGRVRRMAFGAGDYTLDLGIAWTLAEGELATIRADMVMASRAAGLEAPLDTVWIELRETEAFARNCANSAALGFQGRMCIHPDQVPTANAAYAPAEAEVARARVIAAAVAEAEARGLASIQVDGRFVDYPIVERALRLLRLHERIAAHG